MTLLEIIRLARQRMDDIADGAEDYWITDDSDCKWTNAEFTEYANLAEAEYCSRNPIVDSTTAQDNDSNPLCSLAIVAGTATYAVSPLIVSFKRIKLALGDRPLVYVGEERRWQLLDEAPSTVCWYGQDVNQDAITLYGTPSVNDTASLVVNRLPLSEMTWANRETDTPEIRERDHIHLLYWIEHLAYKKGGEESRDIAASRVAAQEFTEQVGPPIAAIEEDVHREYSDKPLRTTLCIR